MRVAPGSTDVSLEMNIGTVGLTITLFDLYTVRSGAAISDKTDMTALVAADSAHSDGKAYELGFGLYRIDVADVFAAGSPRVTVIVVDQNGDVTMMEVEIDPGAGVQAIWDAATSALTTAGSIGKKLADWVLGTDSKVLLSANAQTGVTIPTVTTTTNLTNANPTADQIVTALMTAAVAYNNNFPNGLGTVLNELRQRSAGNIVIDRDAGTITIYTDATLTTPLFTLTMTTDGGVDTVVRS